MDGKELLKVVEAIHLDKNIEKEIVFEGIEQAILSAAKKHFGEDVEIVVDIDRESGNPAVKCDENDLESEEIGDLMGRIAAQTAKQVMIQKIREAERDSLIEEYQALHGHIVSGTVSAIERGSVIVNLGKVDGILPRSEQIPSQNNRAKLPRVNDRIRAVVIEVKKMGSRVRIILSRTHPEMVRRLFELEIPEVSERIIEVRSLAREAGQRSKVAVSCIDSKIDSVGACVGVRGSRIKNIVQELEGERVDIVRWNDSLQVLVPNALTPAEVEDVILCPMLGKVIVLVRDDQLPLAIGRNGQNVRLASKLVGWDIDVMTQANLDARLEESVVAFSVVPGINEDLAENLVSQGFFSFDDLSIIEPDELAELGGLTAEQCDEIIAYADVESLRLEEEEEEARRLRKQQRQAEQAEAAEKQSESPVDSEDKESGAEADSPKDESTDATDDTAVASDGADLTEAATDEAVSDESETKSTEVEDDVVEQDTSS